MPNNYFRFKKFLIRQEACAMKVCTDSCILGSYAASAIASHAFTPENILDIGAGTGLLSLMLAQKSTASIDAVEIQESCWMQMRDNFQHSPWQERLRAIHADIKNWKVAKKYDFIISNPPFYENDLKGENSGRTIAMHDSALLLGDLIKSIQVCIHHEGSFCVMIPASRKMFFERELAINNAYVTSVLAIKHRESNTAFRLIYTGNFYLPSVEKQSAELNIEDDDGYTKDFTNLLHDYYLNL